MRRRASRPTRPRESAHRSTVEPYRARKIGDRASVQRTPGSCRETSHRSIPRGAPGRRPRTGVPRRAKRDDGGRCHSRQRREMTMGWRAQRWANDGEASSTLSRRQSPGPRRASTCTPQRAAGPLWRKQPLVDVPSFHLKRKLEVKRWDIQRTDAGQAAKPSAISSINSSRSSTERNAAAAAFNWKACRSLRS